MNANRAWSVARRWLPLVGLCVVVAVAASLVRSTQQTAVYQSTAKLLFRQQDFSQALVGLNSSVTGIDPARQAATNIALVSAATVQTETASKLGVPASAVRRDTLVQAEGQSDVVSIIASGSSPRAAQRLADTYAEAFVAFRREADRATLVSAERVIQTQIAQLGDDADGVAAGRRRTLEQNAEQLRVLASLQNGGVQVVQSGGLPDDPSSPRTLRSALLAALAGLLIGVALVVTRRRFDQRLRTVDEIAELLDAPTLAVVAQARVPVDMHTRDEPALEPFRLLHASLKYFPASAGVRTIALTSSIAGEGKSTIAANLALAAAEAGDRALLVEADFRAPRLAGYLGVRGGHGLSEFLSGRTSLDAVLTPVGRDGSELTFDFLPCGVVPPNPTVLLASDLMQELLVKSRSEYDLVVIDGPPVLVVSDAVPILAAADGVIIATRLDITRRRALRDLHDKLGQQHVNVVGFVANGVRQSETAYGYGYGSRASTADPGRPPEALAAGAAADNGGLPG